MTRTDIPDEHRAVLVDLASWSRCTLGRFENAYLLLLAHSPHFRRERALSVCRVAVAAGLDPVIFAEWYLATLP